MSAVFIILYAGAPIRLPEKTLVPAARATTYISTADALLAVYQSGLNPNHCEVVGQEEAIRKEEGK